MSSVEIGLVALYGTLGLAASLFFLVLYIRSRRRAPEETDLKPLYEKSGQVGLIWAPIKTRLTLYTDFFVHSKGGATTVVPWDRVTAVAEGRVLWAHELTLVFTAPSSSSKLSVSFVSYDGPLIFNQIADVLRKRGSKAEVTTSWK